MMNSNNKKIKHMGELAWFLGLSICALGVCFATKSGFGVSMVVAPAYVLYLKVSQYISWFTFGIGEYCLQGTLIIVLAIILGRFKKKYILTLVSVIFYGLCVDIWRYIFGGEVYGFMWQRVISCVVGIVVTSFSIAMVLRTYLPQEAYEMFVKEITDNFSLDMNKVKWIYDISSLVIAIILMLVLFREFSFEIIGVATVICTLVNAPLIAAWGKLLDKMCDFSPYCQGLNSFINKNN